MKYSMVVNQNIDDVELVAVSNDMGERIRSSASVNIFPTGSDWGDYLGARSFRFVPIVYSNYLLSYTLVLDAKQGEWDGQLHAWGIVGSLESFLTQSSLSGFTPRDLFINYAEMFKEDKLFKVMLQGLGPTETSVQGLKLPWILQKIWFGQKLGFTWKYQNSTQWSNVENWLYDTFLRSIPGKWWRNYGYRPKTFSTFTLSTTEPTEIIAIPNKSRIMPIFGFVN
jgi:hypothetical protein